MADACPYRAAALADGWIIGPNGKWWRPSNDSGARYCDTPRAFRYICEDHDIGPFAKATT